MAFIAAYGIQQNEEVFLEAPETVGQNVTIPTPSSGGNIDGDYWAVPVGIGAITGFNFENTTPGDTNKPTPDSFHVVRISTSYSNDFWYVVGTSTAYIAVSAAVECCGPTAGMPVTVPCLSPCSVICDQSEAGGDYSASFGLPTLGGGQTYHLCGYLNNLTLPTPSGAGYANTTTLLAFLNANWNITQDSPPTSLVWTVTADHKTLIVTQTDGPGTDVICLYVYAA